ncbi:hypothetical protein PR048_025497 [Dryococelus australis]|uniref:Ig-like domain-containing protein n=1 Tax=Dryococelus australis TaxID=614101 RepID=A0ABQ9GRH6_9NEOP|nr:hypothetical protein PR048_025497 [Dryococelus australis]
MYDEFDFLNLSGNRKRIVVLGGGHTDNSATGATMNIPQAVCTCVPDKSPDTKANCSHGSAARGIRRHLSVEWVFTVPLTGVTTVTIPPDKPVIYDAKRRDQAKILEHYNEGSDVNLICEVTGDNSGVARSGIGLGSPWWKDGSLAVQPLRPLTMASGIGVGTGGAAILLPHPTAILDVVGLLPPTRVTFDFDPRVPCHPGNVTYVEPLPNARDSQYKAVPRTGISASHNTLQTSKLPATNLQVVKHTLVVAPQVLYPSVHCEPETCWWEYQHQLSIITTLNGSSAEQLAYYLTAVLRGPALSILQSLPERHRIEYPTLVSTLELRFGDRYL